MPLVITLRYGYNSIQKKNLVVQNHLILQLLDEMQKDKLRDTESMAHSIHRISSIPSDREAQSS